MEALIHKIEDDSPAAHVGLRAGDRMVAVSGRDDLRDMFDWQLATMGEPQVGVLIQRGDKDHSFEVFLEEDPMFQDFGIVFQSPLFGPIKTCNNACPFCFIDQQPDGLRPSLYVKDDDWRLSYFSNTYITLTNLTDDDRQRIAQIRPGPLYVSVHCTVPDIRIQMLKNPKFAGKILEELRWLKSLGIPVHAQVVVCPGINDGDALSQTLEDLYQLREGYSDTDDIDEEMGGVESVAVIPVGLTQHRGKLDELSPVDKACAQAVIERVETFRNDTEDDDDDFVFLSDEFYHKAGQPLPSYEAYGEFPQLDDGVGTARMLIEDFYSLEAKLPESIDTAATHLILTGKLAAMTLQPIVQRLNEVKGLYVDLSAVDSDFWGEAIGVAGLVTGQDILGHLKGQDLSRYQSAIIPSVMLKEDTDLFLDGHTVNELSQALGVGFQVIDNPYSARELLEKLELIDVVPSACSIAPALDSLE